MDWLGAATAAGQLGLALVVLASAPRSPLAIALGLLCLDIAGWKGATLANEIAPRDPFRFGDHALSSLTAPLALDFALVFAGERRSSHVARSLAYAVCGSLAAVSALAALTRAPLVRALAEPWWATWLLAGSIPTMGYALLVLVRHLRTSADPLERARTRIVLAAFGGATVLGATEVIGALDPWNESLGSVGMLFAGSAMALVTLRLRLLERDVPLRVIASVLVVAALVVVIDVVAFRIAGNGSILVATITAAAGIAAVAGREWFGARMADRERRAELLALGRFSAQMAHDLRNPLAALRGSVQLLEHDLVAPAPSIDRLDFVRLMADQVARLDRIVDTYGRLARLDLVRDRVSINDVVRSVLRRETTARGAVRIEEELDDAIPLSYADRDMIATVVENLVRNAFEAMPEGGTLRVRTSRDGGAGEPVRLSIEDTGVGMDARTREQAFDDFFTTKPTGTGLGLPFVQRIVEAHGGRVFLASQLGKGTTVQVVLPGS